MVQLSKILSIDSPEASHEEVLIILMQISPELETPPISSALKIVMDLYSGEYPGYRACNTEYHDLKHTIETYLAMAPVALCVRNVCNKQELVKSSVQQQKNLL